MGKTEISLEVPAGEAGGGGGRLVCPAGDGWRCELWLPPDCLEIV